MMLVEFSATGLSTFSGNICWWYQGNDISSPRSREGKDSYDRFVFRGVLVSVALLSASFEKYSAVYLGDPVVIPVGEFMVSRKPIVRPSAGLVQGIKAPKRPRTGGGIK